MKRQRAIAQSIASLDKTMNRVSVRTHQRKEFVDITKSVADCAEKSGIKHGLCVVFVPHTTCGLTINENADPAVVSDILHTLEKIVPEHGNYRHTEGNSDAHIQSSMTGHSLVIILENGHLQLGTWQGIFLCEFDGPRTREVWIYCIKGG
jgi:secondary thiamine-phosphate synthase enzyme